MTTATQTLLGDIENIARITWVGYSGKLYFVTSQEGIGHFVRILKDAPVQKLDGNWCSVESQFPYRSFEVFVK